MFVKARVFVPGKFLQHTLMFGISLGPTQVKHLAGAPFTGMLFALPTNTRVGLPGTNTLTYYEH